MNAEPPAAAEHVAHARRSPDHVVLEGFHPLKHALRFDATLEAVYAADREGLDRMCASLAPDLCDGLERLPLRIVEASELAELAGGRSHGSPDVVAIARRPAVDHVAILDDNRAAPLVLLEEPTHLGNVGAVVRVAAAAGAAAVLCTGALDPWHPAALRGSAGLHFAVPVCWLGGVAQVIASGRPIVAADPTGEPRLEALPWRAVLALGSERRGLSDALLEHAALRVRIPMRSGVSSLNLATAAAVLLYAGR